MQVIPSLKASIRSRDIHTTDPGMAGARAWVIVQCFANFVSMDIMANTLLAVGASPAMVHSNMEAAEFAQLTSGER